MTPLAIIDAFTDSPFAGNPAAVCLLDRWPSDAWLQRVGREMNLSETAFLVRRSKNDREREQQERERNYKLISEFAELPSDAAMPTTERPRGGAKTRQAAAAERQLVELLLGDPALVPVAAAKLTVEEITHTGLRRILAELYAIHAAGTVPDLEQLRVRLEDRPDLFDAAAHKLQPVGLFIQDREEWLARLLERFVDMKVQAVPRSVKEQMAATTDQPRAAEFELRWFTPKVEVALCGHATLASAHFLWEDAKAGEVITFHTRKSGTLTAKRLASGEIELDFPARPATPGDPPVGLLEALGAKAVAVGRNQDDYLVEVTTAAEVRTLAPDFARLAQTRCRGVIVTAKSDDARFDFVSRFFAPAAGVNEDPVTGSAHCCLSEWWTGRLGKDEMTGYQASERGGVVRVVRANGRVKLIGRAVTITRGELLVSVE